MNLKQKTDLELLKHQEQTLLKQIERMEKGKFTEGQEHEFKQLLCKWQNVRNKIYQIENSPFKQQIKIMKDRIIILSLVIITIYAINHLFT